ncbi:hypothetical protein TNCV_4690431 [Trichonephila clavipes]|nr:hypothetical protein TNCV_4690431 [Trichonephila clavipes]
MIRAWCRSGPIVQKGLIYVKYVESQTFYQWCCVGYSSGGVLVTIPCVKIIDGAVLAAAFCNCNAGKKGQTRGYGTTPLSVKGDIEDVSSELDNGSLKLHFLVRRNKDTTASHLSRELYTATGTRVSVITVTSKLHEYKNTSCLHPDQFWEQESSFLKWCTDHRD